LFIIRKLHGVVCQLDTDVSRQPICPFIKGKAVKQEEELNLNICSLIIITIYDTNFNNIKSFQLAANALTFHESWLLSNVKKAFRKISNERLFNYSLSLRPDVSYRHPLYKYWLLRHSQTRSIASKETRVRIPHKAKILQKTDKILFFK